MTRWHEKMPTMRVAGPISDYSMGDSTQSVQRDGYYIAIESLEVDPEQVSAVDDYRSPGFSLLFVIPGTSNMIVQAYTGVTNGPLSVIPKK